MSKKLTAIETGKLIKKHDLSVRAALDSCYSSISEQDKTLNCFITTCSDKAYAHADKIQQLIDDGTLTGPLAGVPIAIKDNICTSGIKTTCASKILGNFVPTYSAKVIELLEDKGMIVIGKTNMDEFAMGSTSETSAFGPVKNPHNTAHVPGGSSGGSCAAVAANEVACALGSDTGGSIRQPSSFCGVTGIKPTYGSVSRYGLVAYGSSLDQIGPIAGSVTDCAALLDIIVKQDKNDSTSVEHPLSSTSKTPFSDSLCGSLKGLRIGIPIDYFGEGLDPEVSASVLGVADYYRSLGAMVEEFKLNLLDYAIPTYYILASAEASSNLSRFDGIKYGYRTADATDLHTLYKRTRSEGFGSEVKLRIMLGSFVLSSGYYDAYYIRALKAKALIKAAFDKAFDKYDMLIGPVAPTTAPQLNEYSADSLKMYLSDIYTVSLNLAGLPGISIPSGMSSKGLPIGTQLIADCFREDILLRAAYAFESGH